VEPQLITLIEFTTNFDDYEAEFVKIDGVSFTDGGGTFTNGADYSIAVGEDTTIFRIHFWDVITGTIPNNADVQGIAVSHNNEGKIAPRMQSDITLVVTPVAEFSASETEITVGDTIQFSDLSTNDPTNWEWDFGDSSSPGTIQNPEHIYSTTGNYTVSLVAANAAGSDTITKTNYITVGPVVIAPVADFMAAETVITEGNTVQFQDLSTNDPTSWIWDFGDGSSPGTLQSPSYTYSSAGTYTVSLIAANSAGPDTITKTDYITVNAVVIAPVADFSADTTIIIEGDSIQFTDITTNDPTSWTWDFGDSGSSILQNPSHTYTAVGTYTVVLVATNSAGSYTITKTDFISVNPLVIKPVADFTASETNITEGDPIQFTDLSTNEPTTWLWDFGDNGSSTEQKPLYTYTIAGTYSVSLIATNSAGADTITKTDHITVDPLVITPVADFSASETNIIEGDTVQFTDLSTNDPTTWAWDFGDSGASSEQNPEHIYTTSGTYTVVLIAENSAGPDTLTKTAHITVDPLVIKPVADFSASETNIIEG
ncbi:MAG: PKD domain-containing protein, partial [Gammaproteobacteria bacterium]|nr:PKD domain-containing protein [Gammaproteobacteria bacterium]